MPNALCRVRVTGVQYFSGAGAGQVLQLQRGVCSVWNSLSRSRSISKGIVCRKFSAKSIHKYFPGFHRQCVTSRCSCSLPLSLSWSLAGCQKKQLTLQPCPPLVFHSHGFQDSQSRCKSISRSGSNCAANTTAEKSRFEGPGLSDFISSNVSHENTLASDAVIDESYLPPELFHGRNRAVYIETYGCQMNVNDTEIAWSILQQNGFERASFISQADVILAVTCAIREGAESKIWNRIQYFKSMKRRRGKKNPLTIGILGCMAERLKHKILEKEKMVDVVCGPDAYRDLPRLLAESSSRNEAAVNVQLSLEETYADVVPVRISADSPSAYVSIMRGCDNMCTYCIVPFTRGRERSRPLASIVNEVETLSDQGVKEVVLLGQNVNSYRQLSSDDMSSLGDKMPTTLSAGFSTVYKPKTGGLRFARLLEAVAKVNPEMRIRFTSPHPKDFPDEVLQVIVENRNICRQLHLPAQSGSSRVLAAMGRGYTREAYLVLVERIKSIIPDVALSSDFIAGFCGEEEEDHRQTVSLMEIVQYNFAFCFPYSMREKTRAYHRLKDDVPFEVKKHRHMELTDTFRKYAQDRHESEVGQLHLVLVEGESRKSSLDLSGRNDANGKVVFPDILLNDYQSEGVRRKMQAGDYVAVQITSGNSLGLKGLPLYITSLQEFWEKYQTAKVKQRDGHKQAVC